MILCNRSLGLQESFHEIFLSSSKGKQRTISPFEAASL